jgi:AcrR family transcriptional regulator
MHEVRQYRQRARAEAVEAVRRRIIEAFFELGRAKWFDEITLAEVARSAGASVRTVIRQFGGKEGLVAGVLEYLTPEVLAERTVSPGDIDGAIGRLLDHYESQGDITLRFLAQEQRYPILSPTLEAGRRGHRDVAATNFAPWLDQLRRSERERALDALVIAMDLYTWKLLRRDMGRSAKQTRLMMRALVEAALARFTAARSQTPAGGGFDDS